MAIPLIQNTASDPHVFLVGRPPVGELLGFIRTMTVNGQTADLGALTTAWRTANDHVLELERDEAGAADNPPTEPLPSPLEHLAQEVLASPMFRAAYRFVPTDVAMIDLDRVIVFQKFINLAFVESLKRDLGPSPTPEAILRFCLLDPQRPPFNVIQNAQNMYTLVSPSTDFRFLEAKLLAPEQIQGFDSTGRPVVVLGLAVGYGSNYLNVISLENRLVLSNGSHRAYALRELGISQVPALVQRLTRRDELELVASGDFATNPDRYLRTARPPMLRDYFDASLRMIVPVYRKNRTIRLQFGIEQTDMPG